MFGLKLFHNGILIKYHPNNSRTWHWLIKLQKNNLGFGDSKAKDRTKQWHDYYTLFNGSWLLTIAYQDYHLTEQEPSR